MPAGFARMSDAAATAPTPSTELVFFRRLIYTVMLWTVILAALFSGSALISNGVCIVLLIFLAVTGLAEFYGLAEKRGIACFKWCGIVGGLLLLAGTFLHLTTSCLGINDSPARANDFETGFLILFVLGLCVRQFVSKTNTTGILTIATTLFGLMYVPWLLNFVQKIIFFPFAAAGLMDEGKYFLLYFILITKFS